MAHVKIDRLKASHYAIHSEIQINASPEEVWEVLTDTGSYRDWSAFMVELDGKIANDNTITASFQLNPKKPRRVNIQHKIHVTDGSEFFWAEKGPGGIRDNHHFRVEALPDGTSRFVQSDEIMQGLTWLMGGKLSKIYAKGYQAFNLALKQEVERRVQDF
jgi:hypothetical protein